MYGSLKIILYVPNIKKVKNASHKEVYILTLTFVLYMGRVNRDHNLEWSKTRLRA